MCTSSEIRAAASAVRWAVAAVLMASLVACGGESSRGYVAPTGAPTATALATNGATATPAQATSGAPPSAPASASVPAVSTSASTSTPATLNEQIAVLERSGAYPALDRSSDIAGPDTNRNGVRDDVETWINGQPVTDIQRKALMQRARALQRTLLVDIEDRAALQRSGDELMSSSNCGGDVFSPFAIFTTMAGKIEAMTADTRERARRYMQYNAASSGSSTTLPDGNTCEP